MKNTDLVIFCGQSNMQGQTEKQPEELSVIEGAFEYRFLSKQLAALKHPVGESIDHQGNFIDRDSCGDVFELLEKAALLAPVQGNANMVPSFCKSYIKESGRNIVAVHTAKGSTQIDYWLKGEKGYAMMHKKVTEAIEKVNPEHIFFVWLQGESDAIAGKSKEEYKEQLKKLSSEVKKELGVERFGIIQVGRFTMDDRDFPIIDAQKEICKENSFFVMLTDITEKLIGQSEFMNPFVRGHYSCKGQEKIGTLAGQALGNLLKKGN